MIYRVRSCGFHKQALMHNQIIQERQPPNKMNVILLIAIVFANCLVLATSLKSDDIRNYLGTRTPYRFKYNKDDSKIKYPGCKDAKIWMLIRHGTRLPSPKDIIGSNTTLKDLRNKILLNYNAGKTQLDPDQIQQFENWHHTVKLDNAKDLTPEGGDEMVLLAERMHKRFPNAVRKKYNNQTFFFRYTATQRAQQSARHFALGLFDKKGAQDVVFEPATKVDTVLRFYKHCDRWQEQVKKNMTTYRERLVYSRSLEMNISLEAISKRLGFDSVLTLDEVNLMYKICGFETSWHKHRTSPWCYAFDVESIKKFEYYHDLQLYYVDGYARELTYRQACLAMKTMFDIFSKERPDATFLFAHSGTLLKILSYLELYKPASHLRGDSLQADRPWRASEIDCFASNLAFVLYKCKDEEFVLTLHQERVVKLPMCHEELCPLNRLRDYFRDSIHNCDYSDMCSLEPRKNEL